MSLTEGGYRSVESISSKSPKMQNGTDTTAFSCLSKNCYEPFNCIQEEGISLLSNSGDMCSCYFMHGTMESSIGSVRPSMLVTGYVKVNLSRQNFPRQLHTATPVQETDPAATGVTVFNQTEVLVYH